MSSWNKTRKEGIVLFSRASEGKHQISLNENSRVEIIGEIDGWYKIKYNKQVGIFPSNYIKIIGVEDDLSKIDKQDREKFKRALAKKHSTAIELMSLTETALASEILQVLREWGNELNKLRTEKRKHEYLSVKRQMATLVGLRKQIVSSDFNNLPQPKRKEISDKVISVIEEGSRELNLDLIVRVEKGEKKGQRAHEENTPVVELFRQYQNVQRKEMHVRKVRELKQSLQAIGGVDVDVDPNDVTVKATEEKRTQAIKRVFKNYDPADRIQRVRQTYDLPSGSIALLLEVKACIFTVGEPTELYFSLYNKQQKRFISEEYMIELTALGMPKDERLIQNIRTLFCDISEEHFTSDLYLVCRIFRRGKMVLDEKAIVSSSELMKKQSLLSKEEEDPEEETFYRRPFGCAVLPITPTIISEFLMQGKEFAPGNLALFFSPNEANYPILHEMIINGNGNYERLPHSRAIGIAVGVTMYHGKNTQELIQNNPNLKLGSNVCLTKALQFPQVISPGERRNELYVTVLGGQFADARNVKIQCRVLLKSDPQNPLKCIRRHAGLFKEPFHYYHSSIFYHIHNPLFNETMCIDLEPEQLEDAVLVFLFSNCSQKRAKHERFGFAMFNVVDLKTGVIVNDSQDHMIELYKYAKDMDKGLSNYVKDHSKLVSLKSHLNIKTSLVSTRCTQDIHLNNLLKWNQKKDVSLETILNQFQYVQITDIVKYIREISDSLFNILITHDNEQVSDQVYQALLGIIDSLSKKQFSKFREVVDDYVDNFFHFPQPQVHKWLLHSLIKSLTYDNDKRKEKEVSKSLRAFHYMFRFIVISRRNCEEASAKMMSASEFVSQTEKVFQLLNSVISIPDNTALIAAQDQMLKFIGPLFEVMATIFPSDNHALLGRITRQFLQAIPDTGRNNTIEGKLTVASVVSNGSLLLRGEARKELLEYLCSLIRPHMNRTSTERRLSVRVFADIVGSLQKLIIDPSLNTTSKNKNGELSIRDSFLTIFSLLPHIHKALQDLRSELHECQAKVERTMELFSRQVPEDELFSLNEELQKIQDVRSELLSAVLGLFYVIDAQMFADCLKLYHEAQKQHYAELAKTQQTSDKKSATSTKAPTEQDNKMQMIGFMFDIFHDVIENSPIPEYWIAFNVFCFHTVLDSFQMITAYLEKNIKFEKEIYNRVFQLAMSFARTKFLQVEGYSSSKSAKILVYNDMRVTMVSHLRAIWESLSQEQKMNFVPHLVDSILRLPASIPKKEIYVDALNIYYTILELEYKSTKSLRQCQGITGSILDEYIVKDQIDSKFKQFFEEVLKEKFEKDASIREEGTKFLDNTKMLIELIGAVQRYNDDQEDQKTTSLIKVMQYVSNADQQEIFFKYVHALADVHAHNENYVEAALTLMLHSEKLSFESTELLSPIGELFPQEIERARKEKLYKIAIDYFDKGRDWERAIRLIRILCPYYESTTYEYEKLSEMMRLQGELFMKIADQKRFFSSYFYVAYYGKSFQEMGLKNKEFIYKGDEAERLMDFVERIMKRFPNAEMLQPLATVTEEQLNGDGQYIQIMTVYPSSFEDIRSKCSPKPRNPNVSKNIAGYSELNHRVKAFMYSKTFRKNPKDSTMNEMADLYTNLYFLLIGDEDKTNGAEVHSIDADEYPHIVRRKPVLKRVEVQLSPVENAVKNIEDKNAEIMELVISHNLDKKPDTGKLSMSLNGTIDAAVNGGVNKYVNAFFIPEFIQANPDKLPSIQRLQRALDDQLVVLGKGLEMYRKFGSAQTKQHVEHLFSYWATMKDQLKKWTSMDMSQYLSPQ